MKHKILPTDNWHTKEFLLKMQALPLYRKIGKTISRIIEWYNYFDGKVYVSFSGGKDSTVLLHIARSLFPTIKAVFVDTGLEFIENKKFVETIENVDWIYPKTNYLETLIKYGWNFPSKDMSLCIYYARKGSKWALNKLKGLNTNGTASKFKERYVKWGELLLNAPFIISNKCCLEMKEKPFRAYEKKHGVKAIIGTMADESQRREDSWLKTGCNAFDSDLQTSQPISFWTEQDILEYITIFNVPYSTAYGSIIRTDKGLLMCTGEQTTGCEFCPTGCHLDKENKYQRMAKRNPRRYDYCIGGGEYNEQGMWIPNKQGLGLGKVLDYLGVDYKPKYSLLDYKWEDNKTEKYES